MRIQKKSVELFADRFEGKFEGAQEPGKHDKNQVQLYQATIPLEGGVSGGPVFDEAGRVTAVARSSMVFEGGEHEGATVSFLTPVGYCLETGFNNLMLPEWSWEYRQIPNDRQSDHFTVHDLVTFGHVLFDPPIN